MKFPTSSSSNFTVSAGSNPVTNNAQVSNLTGDSTSITIMTPSTAMATSTPAVSEQTATLKRNSEVTEATPSSSASHASGNTQNVASSLSTTAGNFFRKYTSPNSSASTTIEMGHIGNKSSQISEADKVANMSTSTLEASSSELTIIAAEGTATPQSAAGAILLPPPQSATSTKTSKVSSSSKPGRAMRSRKVTRAPQPPTDSSANVTPATSKVKRTALSPSKSAAVQRPCQTHSFHTDAAEVQQMETVLLKLLDDFNSGKLRAFGQGCSMEQMSSIRDQQESLAKLHFEIGARQDPSAPLSEEGLRAANENMDKLMGRLETLSVAIGQLNPASSEKNSPAATGGNGSAAGNSNFGAKNSHDSQKLDR